MVKGAAEVTEWKLEGLKVVVREKGKHLGLGCGLWRGQLKWNGGESHWRSDGAKVLSYWLSNALKDTVESVETFIF